MHQNFETNAFQRGESAHQMQTCNIGYLSDSLVRCACLKTLEVRGLSVTEVVLARTLSLRYGMPAYTIKSKHEGT